MEFKFLLIIKTNQVLLYIAKHSRLVGTTIYRQITRIQHRSQRNYFRLEIISQKRPIPPPNLRLRSHDTVQMQLGSNQCVSQLYLSFAFIVLGIERISALETVTKITILTRNQIVSQDSWLGLLLFSQEDTQAGIEDGKKGMKRKVLQKPSSTKKRERRAGAFSCCSD